MPEITQTDGSQRVQEPGYSSLEDAELEPPEIRHLKNSIADLNSALVKSQSALKEASSNLTAQQSVMTGQHSQINDLRQQNSNLRHRLSAVELEADARAQNNDQLQTRLEELQKEKEKQQKSDDATKVLGRKRLHDLGPTQIKATRAAYRKKFLEAINTFGINRGLELETMILRDKDGERLVINATVPHTFAELNKAEKKRVTQTSNKTQTTLHILKQLEVQQTRRHGVRKRG